jgi:hypothetical protein
MDARLDDDVAVRLDIDPRPESSWQADLSPWRHDEDVMLPSTASHGHHVGNEATVVCL